MHFCRALYFFFLILLCFLVLLNKFIDQVNWRISTGTIFLSTGLHFILHGRRKLTIPFSWIKVIKKFFHLVILFGKMRFKLQKCCVPKPTPQNRRISELPLFLFAGGFFSMPIVSVRNWFPDVLSLNHVLPIELYDEVWTVRTLHFDHAYGFNFNRRLRQLFDGHEDVRHMTGIVFRHIGEIV